MKGKGKSKVVTKVKSELESDYSFISYSSGYSSSNLTKESCNFSTVLQNRDIKDLCIDDLRAVQFELEDQLTTAIKRRKHLENKIFSLETLHSKKDKRSRSTDSVEKKTGDERPPKKAKESSSKAHSSSTSSQAKSKYIPQLSDSYQEVSKPTVKNDAPSRFWTFIEPYCADITQDTIRAVEDWISPQENDETFQRIPPLGEHFSKKWPMDDLTDELIEGSKSVENNKGLYSDSPEDHAEVERLLKLGESESSSRVDRSYPTICDRLICSLVGENLMTQLDDTMHEACSDDIVQKTNPTITQICSLSNKDDSLENRLRAEFIESGLLESDGMESKADDDEICRELKRLQNALIPVHEHNTMQKKTLLALAKAEMAKQEVKKKLQELDAKVMEVYRSTAVAKKNKAMNKKLEDQIKRTLRERKKLVEKLAIMK